MRSRLFPITDDHIHFDPVNGRGVEAAKDFLHAGGTHIFLVTKPSWSLGIVPVSGADYAKVFNETLRIAGLIRETGLVVFPVLGVHPAEISRLAERMPLHDAVEVMKGGLDCAAGYIRDGRAIALKSGRPHYEVSPEMFAASNEVLSHALELAAGYRCALQIHAESGPCADVVDMAAAAGMPVGRVVKHYGSPETPLHPSLVARHEAVPVLARERRPFTMESDFMDENSRPGAVTGPKSVPRITKKLLESGVITEEDCWRIHGETPEKVYGVRITL
ncbi:MAG: TatD family hydrolase [Methanoregula sp.]|jgi:TatD-related deoxyribonuclease|uniref:TatD family hydrolase n=1 Tax=Methanoregula sp. TaxID=2052170 RepID=UPI003C271E40